MLGGTWERLIRIAKSVLKRVLGKVQFNYEELHTLICDTESIVKTRLLTCISEDLSDLTLLTPKMFLKAMEIGIQILTLLL